MIEKMLKITVACAKEHRISTLKGLRSLGVLHVEPSQKPLNTETSSSLSKELEKVNRAILVLSEDRSKEETHIYSDIHPEELTEKLIKAISENENYQKEIDSLKKDKEKLSHWGEFSYNTVDFLENNGIFIYFCSAPVKHLSEYTDKGLIHIVSKSKGKTNFILVSKDQLNREELPIASMPSHKMNIEDINYKIAELNVNILENKEIIHDMTESLGSIRSYKTFLEEKLEFTINKETMGEDRDLCYIRGFVPKRCEKMIIHESRKQGWAVMFEIPDQNDQVPTSMAVPKIFSWAKPIFEFIGLYPGYNEWDVSGCFLIFFGIFFAMIIGDAGYAMLFIIITLVLKSIYKRNRRIQLSLNLLLYLSVLTVIWGSLTCSYFSIPMNHLPTRMHGIKFFTGDNGDSNFQMVCFFLGALHLSIARIWQSLINFGKKICLGHFGWALIIWGNFFMAKHLICTPDIPFPDYGYYLYGIGLGLVVFFYVNWREASAYFETPLSLIGSFIDVLSYIRLFAVGVASVYIAENFNQMGVQLAGIAEWLIPFAVLVILMGHLLNIALGLMAVLVHGIRLNSLEFSNHMGLKWTGTKYMPFKKKLYRIKKKEV